MWELAYKKKANIPPATQTCLWDSNLHITVSLTENVAGVIGLTPPSYLASIKQTILLYSHISAWHIVVSLSNKGI